MRIIFLLLLFPFCMSAQTVNLRLYDGVAPFQNFFWNNWKPANKANDTSKVLVDIMQNQTKIRMVLGGIGSPFDNGTGYRKGLGPFDDTVVQKGVYTSGTVPMTFVGLNDSSLYVFTFFGSRNRTDGQATNFSINGKVIQVPTDTNSYKVATFPGLKSSASKLVFQMQQKTGYVYLNAVQISSIPAHGPKAKITIDSTTIHWPNTRVYVNADSSQYTDGTVQWSQPGGPNKAIFTMATYGTSAAVVSGLIPGDYIISLFVQDSLGTTSQATTIVHVIGPVFPVCPVCPAPRKVTGVSYDPITGKATFTYDDGKQ